jgi:hypothetical protein
VVWLVSPIFHHKPPEPGYIDVVQQTQNVTPKYKGVGGWGKRNRDVEAVGGAKVFLCPPAGEAQGQITQMIRSLSSLMISLIIPCANTQTQHTAAQSARPLGGSR